MNTFEQGLDMQPSAPQGFPPWGSIAFAAQIPTIAGNGMPTLLDGHRLGKPMIQMSYDSHDVRWQDLASRLRGILSGGSSQLYQAHGHGSQQAQDGAQPFIVLHLTLLDLAAGFESLMKVFDHPAGTIPVDPLLRVLKRLGGDRTEQDPFEGFHTFGRLRLPDDTGGEVEGAISGCLLHDPLKGRGAGLFRRLSPQPTHQLDDIDGGSNSHMTQMGFAQTDIARTSQAHGAHSLRMGPFNACSMAIGVLELIRLLPLARCKQRLHLLPWVQGERAASGSRTGGPRGTDLTVALRKLHLDERF